MNAIINLTVILALLAFVERCDKEDIKDDVLVTAVPKCVEARIASIAAEEVRNPPAKVYRYNYQGKLVYYITPMCCDIPSQLYDANCELICAPDGGYTGKGDGLCPDFFTARSREQLIWEDKRER